MKRIENIKHRLARIWLSWASFAWVGVLVVAYFAFHAFQGENSISALKELQAQEAELTLVVMALREDRSSLERAVAMLDPESLDPDMLEEQVRDKLGFVHTDEVVILSVN